ncbi:hypothetical protein O3P69_016087 [Scylla paramamosain]|uniref:Ig-like domain-containing protein n=1 Tax=Scylla paramamosain TaxID=85552 RepID=A0AAW0T919_SCYPA
MWSLPLAALLALTLPGWCSWPVGPSFVDAPVNVTVSEGSHAFLPCRVANLGDRSVTWMRSRRLHIITAGLLTYSPDDRHRVLHPKGTDEWSLLIRHARPGDAGWYECQVNSDPKITTPVLLVVKDANLEDPFYLPEHEGTDNFTQARIEGAQERYIQEGSILAVTCTVEHEGRAAVEAVVWYRGAARLDYDSPRGGIALQTEKDPEQDSQSAQALGSHPDRLRPLHVSRGCWQGGVSSGPRTVRPAPRRGSPRGSQRLSNTDTTSPAPLHPRCHPPVSLSPMTHLHYFQMVLIELTRIFKGVFMIEVTY